MWKSGVKIIEKQEMRSLELLNGTSTTDQGSAEPGRREVGLRSQRVKQPKGLCLKVGEAKSGSESPRLHQGSECLCRPDPVPVILAEATPGQQEHTACPQVTNP